MGDDIPHRVKSEQFQRTVSLGKGFTNLKLVDLVSVAVIQGKLAIRLNNLLFECWQPTHKKKKIKKTFL